MADNPQPSRPASGSYGEKAQLEKLKRSLPSSGQPVPGDQAPPPPRPLENPGRDERMPAGRPSGPQPPAGVPISVLQSPDLPPGAVQPTPQPPMPQSRAEYVLMVLDVLETSPETSQETKEWAKLVKGYLIASSQ